MRRIEGLEAKAVSGGVGPILTLAEAAIMGNLGTALAKAFLDTMRNDVGSQAGSAGGGQIGSPGA